MGAFSVYEIPLLRMLFYLLCNGESDYVLHDWFMLETFW